ncbi:MAG: hypothetical protein ACTHWQ_05170 [Sphingobacterium sp.]
MLAANKKEMVRTDFEKFFKSLKKRQQSLSFEVFGSYSASVLNFYRSHGLLQQEDTPEAGRYLVQLFNAGLGNRITPADQQEIIQVILGDPTIDYSLIQAIFE